jgi:hypothetical protein
MRDAETLESGLKTVFRELLTGVNTSFPAVVVDFDGKNKISVQPCVMTQRVGAEPEPLPVLQDVPVLFPGGGGFRMRWPIAPGDYVLVVCSQRSIDNWKQSGGVVPANVPRRFSMSDGVAIPCPEPFDDAEPVGTDYTITGESGAEIRITPSGVVSINGHLGILLEAPL